MQYYSCITCYLNKNVKYNIIIKNDEIQYFWKQNYYKCKIIGLYIVHISLNTTLVGNAGSNNIYNIYLFSKFVIYCFLNTVTG